MVFLASDAEVNDGGSWGLTANSVIKKPTVQAENNDRNGYMKAGKENIYLLGTPCAGISSFLCLVSDGISFFGSGQAYTSYFGVVPALQLSSYLPIEGAGTKDKPWKF